MNPKKVFDALWKPLASIAITLVLGALILMLAGYDASAGFGALFNASFKSLKAFGDMLNKATPLLFCGIAIAVAFRGSIYNLGCEGQFIMGATVSTVVGIYLGGLPAWLLLPLMFLGGAAGGALWGGIAGVIKAKLGISELISTIMLNYIASRFVSYFIRGPVYDRATGNPQSYKIAEQAYFPYLIPGTKFHAGYLLGILFAALVFVLLFRTYYGYEIRAVGMNRRAAETAGISVPRTVIGTMLLSGGLAGLAGTIEICGTSHYLLEGLSAGYGWTGIAVSVLAANNPLGIILTSILFAILNSGAMAMQREADISSSFASILQGMIILAVAVAVTLQPSRKRRKEAGKHGLD